MSELPNDPQEMAGLLDRLEFGDAPQNPVIVPPAPEGDVMAVRSIRWSADFDARVKAAAQGRGTSVSQLIRDLVELELAALENDQPISRADALRALASLRPVNGAA